jgi:hypothetical protein
MKGVLRAMTLKWGFVVSMVAILNPSTCVIS